MNRNVLIINSGIPSQIWKWEDTIKNIIYDKCYVMEYYDDFILHAGDGREIMKCPAVVVLKNSYYHNTLPKYSRDNIFQRDDFHCQYCGEFVENPHNREIDHVIPKASPKCPGSTFENIVLACTTCNRQKSNKTLNDMKHETCWNGKPFKLIKKPEKPTLKIGFARYVAMVHKHNIMWLNYIDGWEKYAKKLGKEYLFDEYEKYLAMREY